MSRTPGTSSGFGRHKTPVASARLMKAVVASLALAALSVCLTVALTLASISASFAG